MEEYGAPTAAAIKKRYAGRPACGDPGEKIGGLAAFDEDGNPEYADVKLGLMDVPYVDWTTLFLLGHLRQRGSYEDELARKTIVPEFGVARPEATYEALRQMEKEGMIVSELDVFDRSTFRKRCAITELGEAYLEYLEEALVQYRKEMDLFYRVYDEQLAPGATTEAPRLRGRQRGEQRGCL